MALGYNAPGVPYNAPYNYDGTGGAEALTGSVAGTIVTSATIVGTGGDKQTSAYIEALVRQNRQRKQPVPPPPRVGVERLTGRVAGLITINGSVLGQAELTLDDELALLLLGAL